jgi:hydrogenase maturation factor
MFAIDVGSCGGESIRAIHDPGEAGLIKALNEVI